MERLEQCHALGSLRVQHLFFLLFLVAMSEYLRYSASIHQIKVNWSAMHAVVLFLILCVSCALFIGSPGKSTCNRRIRLYRGIKVKWRYGYLQQLLFSRWKIQGHRKDRSQTETQQSLKNYCPSSPRSLCACIAVASYFKYSCCVFFSTSATDAVSLEFVGK